MVWRYLRKTVDITNFFRKPSFFQARQKWIGAGCTSPIYCNGVLLHTIQNSGIFSDSKTFVDMKMKKSIIETMLNFNTMMAQYDDEPSREVLECFVRDNFESQNELEDWFPGDFNPEPAFLKRIKDPDLLLFAKRLVWLWPKLGRRLKNDVYSHPEKYSLIPLSNGIIVPGGRFREVYYWDTYWIINGLLISEMYETARGLIDNFIYMVKIYGFVPNGGRIYYAQRSQPPLLTAMAANYIRYTNDIPWLQKNLIYLKREIKFWRRKRMITLEKYDAEHSLAYYAVEGKGPRPESYIEDFDLTTHLAEEDEKEAVYANIKSAAQSGWDFSSRWIFDERGDSRASLSYTQILSVIPVDLNSFIHNAFMSMSYLYGKLGNQERMVYWMQVADQLQNSMREILWNEEDNMWYDYNYKLGEHRRKYYASNVTPLWTGAHKKEDAQALGKMAADYLKRHGILDYKGGVPTSLEYSGQQWDFPNAWPPLQAIVVQGLDRSGHPEAKAMAQHLAKQWVNACFQGFKETGEMFEKYDSVEAGKYGGGGEYTIQTGFGWTNGSVLEFIVTYYSS